ncbi:hypothetical protein SEMRO_424_G139970.2 [Seminavis robusta]|uniref:Uncharacterized protein n=1 Tax=Seminavis robusta TaxID=568900 RepID=A0A9N8E1V9_9STRA|nr:hypothetical protein SEMRO_424_G139970.2 [Seminavis robusta]|eukprot:Sro424_g139970.2  (117) ;mRNA; r:38931-39281
MEQQRGKTVINLPNGKVVGFVVVDDAPAMPWPAVPVPVQDVPVPAAAAVDLDDSHTTLGDDSDELAEIRNLANPPSRPRFTRRTNRNRRTCNQNLDDSDDSDTLLDVSGWGLTQEM